MVYCITFGEQSIKTAMSWTSGSKTSQQKGCHEVLQEVIEGSAGSAVEDSYR
ncbi:MAG: hypothetical protein ACJAVV_003081 [Alphaproteobacteria bacterium]|jgi:hypothetical protein